MAEQIDAFLAEEGHVVTAEQIRQWLNHERTSHDTIDVKRVYIDMAADILTGFFLSQFLYFNLPDKHGRPHRRIINHLGRQWVVISRAEWWSECRLTPRQVDGCVKVLEKLGLIIRATKQIGRSGKNSLILSLVWERFLPRFYHYAEHPTKSPTGDLLPSSATPKTAQNAKSEPTKSPVGDSGTHFHVRTKSPVRDLVLTPALFTNHLQVICTPYMRCINTEVGRSNSETLPPNPPPVAGDDIGEGEYKKQRGEEEPPLATTMPATTHDQAAPPAQPPISSDPGAGVHDDGQPDELDREYARVFGSHGIA